MKWVNKNTQLIILTSFTANVNRSYRHPPEDEPLLLPPVV